MNFFEFTFISFFFLLGCHFEAYKIFVKSVPFLVSVSRTINLVTIEHAPKRTATNTIPKTTITTTNPTITTTITTLNPTITTTITTTNPTITTTPEMSGKETTSFFEGELVPK